MAPSPTETAAALGRGRATAMSRMLSRVTVRRKGPRLDQDEDSGTKDPVWDVIHEDLPFRLVGGTSRTVTIAGVEYEEATSRGDMPYDTDDLADGDLIDITTGESAGSVYRVVEAIKGDQRTARRVPVAEVQRPKEWST